MSSTEKDTIECRICGEEIHHVENHLGKAHPGGMTLAQYKEHWPDAPLYSTKMAAVAKERQEQKAQAAKAEAGIQKMVAKIIPFTPAGSTTRRPMYEIFDLPISDELRSPLKRGQTVGDPIQLDVMENLTPANAEAVPEIDEAYVFRIPELKDITMAIQLNIPLLLWGLHGSGKTTSAEQACARINRPCVRVQHTGSTEEAHIIGQMVVRNGATEFDYGPLAEAMMNGWVYIADEYDMAHSDVIAVYQPVLEGKPLYIKEAPPTQRLVKPHPHFRFVATANTNGSGDDTGLYSGTKMGNAAQYSRFGVTIQIHYPEKQVEVAMIRGRTGITQDMAEKLVDFAERVRAMYEKQEISLPISPRELIRASMIGVIKGGMFRHGIDLAYANRLDQTQGDAVRNVSQRVFG